MTDQWTDRLSDYLDGELPDGERIAVEAHLQGCAECSAVLRDLRRVVRRAKILKDQGPNRDLWPEIATRIGATAAATTKTIDLASHRRARRWSFSLPQLAAAGIALLVLSGGAVWLIRTPTVPVATQP